MESGGPPGTSLGSKPTDGRGGWRAALFLLTVGSLERIGFYGVQANLIMYFTGPLGMSTAAAAAGVNAWAGTVQVLPLAGALAADSRLGRYRAVLAAGVLYLLSLGMLTLSALLQTRPASSASSVPAARLSFFYVALYLLALAQGFHRPCAEALGADQFAPSDGEPGARASRSSYFNWYHFSISWGYVISTTALSYIEDNVGWAVGFGVCWATMMLCLAVFLIGARTYRAEQPVDADPCLEAVRAWAARVLLRRKDAAAGTERLLLNQEPEEEEGEGLAIFKLLPIWLSGVVYGAVSSQDFTLFTKQASTMDRRLGADTGVLVPPAALLCLISFTFITMLPVYDRVFVPFARRVTGHHAGVTTLQRIGAGIALSGVAMVVAALVETKRLRVASDAGLVDSPDVAVPMSLWWVVPQYFIIGLAKVLGDIGLEEFFYDQVPDALRSFGLALSLSAMGAGSYASGALVSAIDWATRSSGESWFGDNLNRAHLDYFYWLLAGLTAIQLAVFLQFANRYVYRNRGEL
ncbi:hypothetical protein QOZ80_1BG0091440 [Eleusine coracana subsp. coracana]|nr:hypothetical protein QOZ80_1BG0091440 [Eleusine coracana subsp. coracana]